ncbi:MAG: hypothetical protein JXA82_17670 [Sedimentisphaerales bacterium]|nr:hypothetical protein [Sedimentisphaerales bacterium]
MQNQETSLVGAGLFKIENSRGCPQCGSQMKETERRTEGSITFVWFACAKADCDGQWMQSYVGAVKTT